MEFDQKPTDFLRIERPIFPTEALCPVLRKFVQYICDQLDLFADMPAVTTLAAVSAATMSKVRIAPLPTKDPKWIETPNIYTFSAMNPSERKTSALNMITEPLREWEKKERIEKASAVIETESVKRALESELRQAEKEGDIKKIHDLSMKLAEHKTVRPGMLLLNSATPEGILQFMKENGGKCAVFADEGSLIQILTGQYSNGRTANTDIVNVAYNGSTFREARKGSGVVTTRALMAMGLCVHPSELRELVTNTDLCGRGTAARFLFAIPETYVGSRDFSKTKAADDTPQREYSELIHSWLSESRKAVLKLNVEAEQLFIDKMNEIEKRRGRDGDLSEFAEWAGKAEGLAAKITAILHCALESQWKNGGQFCEFVTPDTVESSFKILDYAIETARIVFTGSNANVAKAEAVLAKKILEYCAKSKKGVFKDRDASRMTHKSKETIAPALELLATFGWIRESEDGKAWIVHPSALNGDIK